jgi:uncharacterized protein (TIGR03083 family)
VHRTRQLDSVAADARAIATLTAAEPDRPVAACPGWNRADLRAHVSGFARLVPALLAGRAETGSPVRVPVAEAAETFDADAAGLVDALAAADLDAPVPNWSVRPAVGAFWLRRSVHELAVHAVDAGSDAPLATDVATDTVAEYFDTFVATAFAAGYVPPSAATLVLELTDADDQRHDLPDPGPETVVRGAVSDVALALWHRRDLLALHVSGDRGVLERWPRI